MNILFYYKSYTYWIDGKVTHKMFFVKVPNFKILQTFSPAKRFRYTVGPKVVHGCSSFSPVTTSSELWSPIQQVPQVTPAHKDLLQ